MNKPELIKDTVIFSNMIAIMRNVTNKVVSRTSVLIPTTEVEVDTSSQFHAATIAGRLALDLIPEKSESGGEENTTQEENDDVEVEPSTKESEETESDEDKSSEEDDTKDDDNNDDDDDSDLDTWE